MKAESNRSCDRAMDQGRISKGYGCSTERELGILLSVFWITGDSWEEEGLEENGISK